MSKVDKVVQVEKELNEIAELLCGVVTQLASKVPLNEIAASNLIALEKAIAGVSELPAEFQDDLAAVQKSFMLPIADMIAALLKKTPPGPKVKAITSKGRSLQEDQEPQPPEAA